MNNTLKHLNWLEPQKYTSACAQSACAARLQARGADVEHGAHGEHELRLPVWGDVQLRGDQQVQQPGVHGEEGGHLGLHGHVVPGDAVRRLVRLPQRLAAQRQVRGTLFLPQALLVPGARITLSDVSRLVHPSWVVANSCPLNLSLSREYFMCFLKDF